MGVSPSTFRIADHTLVRCEAGSLEVEATLFGATAGTRTTTTAGSARARLARSGLTPALAVQAVEAIDPEALASYVRADCVRAVLSKLGPCEVFAGKTYDRGTQTYEGPWIDLRALAGDLRVRSAGLVLQGLYLVAMLDELAPDTELALENGGGGEAARMAFLKPRSVISALAQVGPRTSRARWDEEDSVRAELARFLRDRSMTGATAPARARHLAIEQVLAEIDKPPLGPLSNSALWAIERQLMAKDLRGALERIQSYVRSHGGETASTRYLRAHLALVEGVEPPRRIAEDLLDEGRSGPPFHELELLKARAWMAAGGWTYARHFARGLVNDPNVPDSVSLAAYEIIEAAKSRGVETGPSMPAVRPPDAPSSARGSITATPIYVVAGSMIEPTPSSLNLPIDFEEPSSEPRPSSDRARSLGPEDPTEIIPAPSEWAHHYETNGEDTHVAPPVFVEPLPREPRIPIDRGHQTSPPPPMSARPPIVVPAQAPVRYVPEDVEALSLPAGLSDRHLAEGVAARNGNEVRIVSTRFSRLLGREYREKYDVHLRTDAQAVEWMQRHLVMRWGETGLNGPEAMWDVRRHGALLSEILARTLGAEWVDVSPSEIGYWAMFVPPRTRTWPFGRVYRFLTLGHREKDLVSYYLDLVSRARHG
jgi:hypothetical protein